MRLEWMASPRRLVAFLGLATVGAVLLGVALSGVSDDVKLAIAIAAIACHVLAYILTSATLVRAYRAIQAGDDREERVLATRRRVGFILPLFVVTPFVVTAANPWGLPMSYAVGFGATFLTHFVFTQVTIITGAIMQARKRRARRA